MEQRVHPSGDRRRRSALLAIAGLAVAAAIFLCWPSPPTPEPEADPEPRDVTAEDGADRASPPADGPPVPAPGPGVAVEPVEPDGMLRFVDARSGEAISDVEVAFVTNAQLRQQVELRRLMFARSAAERVFRPGVAEVTASDGRFDVSRLRESGWIVARRGDLLGVARFEADEAYIGGLVRMVRPLRIRVQVVDRGGAPVVGVPVALRLENGATLVQGTTEAPGGEVVLVDDTLPWMFLKELASGYATFAFPASDAPRSPFSRREPPSAPIRLILPPTGSVRVAAIGADGAAYPGAARVTLRRASDELYVSALHAPLEGGVARFPFVGLGMDLVATIRPGEPTVLQQELRFAGPHGNGEEVAREVLLDGEALVVRARLVDGERAPCARAYRELTLELSAHEKVSGRRLSDADPAEFLLGTDDAGQVHVVFDVPKARASGRTLLVGCSGPGGWLRRSIVLPALLAPGTLDLGDLVLDEMPPLLSGTVVDEEGSPVPAADVTVTIARASKSGVSFSARADEQGRFVVRGDVAPGEIDVSVARPGYYANEAPSAPQSLPATAARLLLRRGGGLIGSVAPPAWFPLGETLEAMLRVQVVGEAARVLGARREEDGRRVLGQGLIGPTFRFPSLAPGPCDVEVLYDGRVVASVRDIIVARGEPVRDPRLQRIPIELQSKRYRVTVRDTQGNPVRGARLSWRSAEEDSLWSNIHVASDGMAELVVYDERPLVAVVTHAELRTSELIAVQPLTDVRLQASVDAILDVELVGSHEALPEGLSWSARPQWLGPLRGAPRDDWGPSLAPENRDFRSTSFDERSRASFRLRDPGLYRVLLEVRDRGERSGGEEVAELPPDGVKVTERTGQRFSIRIPIDDALVEKARSAATR